MAVSCQPVQMLDVRQRNSGASEVFTSLGSHLVSSACCLGLPVLTKPPATEAQS